MFVNVVDKDIVILDHNLAFDRAFNQENFNGLHICRDFWFGAEGLLEREHYQPRLEAAIATAEAVINDLPDEWTDSDPTVVPHLRATLEAVSANAFWSAIQ